MKRNVWSLEELLQILLGISSAVRALLTVFSSETCQGGKSLEYQRGLENGFKAGFSAALTSVCKALGLNPDQIK